MDEMHFMADVILRWFYVAISISNFIFIIISFLVDCICHWTPLKWIMLMPNDGGTGKLAEWERDTSDRNLFIGKIGRNHRFILNSVSARCLCFNCYNNLIIDYKTKNKAIFIQFSGISKETYHVHIQHKKKQGITIGHQTVKNYSIQMFWPNFHLQLSKYVFSIWQ